MTLIQRYSIASEYADMLSTAPKNKGTSRRSRSPPTWLSKSANHVSSETTAWRDAVFPSTEDLQAVLRRMRADPDMSQTSIFGFCAPVFGFIYILAVFLVMLRVPKVHIAVTNCLGDASAHMHELVLGAGAICIGLIACLVSVRLVILIVANAVGAFLQKRLEKKERPVQDGFQLSEANVLIGSIFM